MPIYEYKCTVCSERFDVEQSIKDDTLTTLPGDDHEHVVKKVFHPVGISFKGEGFYKNDSRGSKKAPSTAGATPASTGDAASSTPASSSSESSSSESSSSSGTTTKKASESSTPKAAPASKD